MVRALAFVNRKAMRSKEKNALLLFGGITERNLVWRVPDSPWEFCLMNNLHTGVNVAIYMGA
jgi:hypothetical protein